MASMGDNPGQGNAPNPKKPKAKATKSKVTEPKKTGKESDTKSHTPVVMTPEEEMAIALQQGVIGKLTLSPSDSTPPLKIRVPSQFDQRKALNLHLHDSATRNVLYWVTFTKAESIRLYDKLRGGLLTRGNMNTHYFINRADKAIEGQKIRVKFIGTEKTSITKEELEQEFSQNIPKEVYDNLQSVEMDVAFILDAQK